MKGSVVVTGGARGIGLGIATHLVAEGFGVVVLDTAAPADDPPEGAMAVVHGDAADEAVAETAADRARAWGPLTGWVNNASVFEDTWLHEEPAQALLDAVTRNLAPCLTGSRTAVRSFLRHGIAGSIVNISSHQAARPVRGCMAYATAKSAVEAVTRSLAVDYGSNGVRANALSLGTIETERYRRLIARQADEIPTQMARLHALGPVGRIEEVAATVAFLLSDASAFITGANIPVDGGRAIFGSDPEAQRETLQV